MIRTVEVDPPNPSWPAKGTRNEAAWTRGRFIKPDTLLVDKSGTPVLLHARFPGSLGRMRSAVEMIPMASGKRAQGQQSNSRSFGWMPRNPPYQQFACHAAFLHATHPAAATAMVDLSGDVADAFRTLLPEVAARQAEQVAPVLPEWTLPGGLFTAGIINRSWAVRYHRDSRNFKDSWSAMVVFKRNVHGGHLDIPELGVTLDCTDESLVLFDGQSWWHGVTPIMMLDGQPLDIARDAQKFYRISIVWYARSDQCQCLPWADEVAYGQERERTSAITKMGDQTFVEA